MLNSNKTKHFLSALAVFVIGITANHFASIYATKRASDAVADIILSNIPTINVDLIFTFGPVALWLILLVALYYKPQKIPFAFEALGLLVLIRAAFVTLTHIGPSPERIIVDYTGILKLFTAGGDLFFSAHTALPFMMALIFWNEKPWRLFFIAASIFFGVVVLLGHLHYSIDVASAFFITYTVYHIATIIFKPSLKIFKDGWDLKA